MRFRYSGSALVNEYQWVIIKAQDLEAKRLKIDSAKNANIFMFPKLYRNNWPVLLILFNMGAERTGRLFFLSPDQFIDLDLCLTH